MSEMYSSQYCGEEASYIRFVSQLYRTDVISKVSSRFYEGSIAKGI